MTGGGEGLFLVVGVCGGMVGLRRWRGLAELTKIPGRREGGSESMDRDEEEKKRA